jgi:hypothetical protein
MTRAKAEITARNICLKHEGWKPGKTAVTDLRTFMNCLSKSTEGYIALDRFIDYEKNPPPMQVPQIRAVFNASVFLNIADTLAGTKENVRIAECSNFAYDAIGRLLLNKEIRDHYNVCQVGMMRDPSTLRYAHNICVLIPKESGSIASNKNLSMDKLPNGSLIVDPWARALGHPADTTLAVPLSKFHFKEFFDPFIINYNSGADETLEDTLANWKPKHLKVSSSSQPDNTTELSDYFIKLRKFKEQLNAFEANDAPHTNLKTQGMSLLACLTAISGPEDKPKSLSSNSLNELKQVLDRCNTTLNEIKAPDKTNTNVQALAQLSQSISGKSSLWKKLGIALLVIGCAALVCVGILAAIPSGGSSMLLTAIGIAGAKAALGIASGVTATGAIVAKAKSNKLGYEVTMFKSAVTNSQKKEQANEAEPLLPPHGTRS